MKKRFFSVLLALAMVLTLTPAGAWAAEDGTIQEEEVLMFEEDEFFSNYQLFEQFIGMSEPLEFLRTLCQR